MGTCWVYALGLATLDQLESPRAEAVGVAATAPVGRVAGLVRAEVEEPDVAHATACKHGHVVEGAFERVRAFDPEQRAHHALRTALLDLGNPEIETAEIVADRIRQGLKYVAADRLIPAPDCGMKYMPRQTAFGKLKAMCDAAAIVRREIS